MIFQHYSICFYFLVEHYSICIVNKLDVISEMPVIVTGGRRAHGKFYFASLIDILYDIKLISYVYNNNDKYIDDKTVDIY